MLYLVARGTVLEKVILATRDHSLRHGRANAGHMVRSCIGSTRSRAIQFLPSRPTLMTLSCTCSNNRHSAPNTPRINSCFIQSSAVLHPRVLSCCSSASLRCVFLTSFSCCLSSSSELRALPCCHLWVRSFLPPRRSELECSRELQWYISNDRNSRTCRKLVVCSCNSIHSNRSSSSCRGTSSIHVVVYVVVVVAVVVK